MFDKSWENEIYKNKKQINKYPFDWVVSSTNRHIKKKNKLVGLEIGCGVGNNIPFLLKYGFNKIYKQYSYKQYFIKYDLRKIMFSIDPGVNTQIYLKEKDF